MENLFVALASRYPSAAQCAAALGISRQAYSQATARRRLSDRAAIRAAAILGIDPGRALLTNAENAPPPITNPCPHPPKYDDALPLYYVKSRDRKKDNRHKDDGIKADRVKHAHKITSPEQDKAVDLIRWVLAVAKLPADSPRFNYYVSRWRVPEKIEHAKAEGTFDATISKCPPIDPAWVRLVPAALAAYADFAGIKPPKPEPTFSTDAIKIIKPKRRAAT